MSIEEKQKLIVSKLTEIMNKLYNDIQENHITKTLVELTYTLDDFKHIVPKEIFRDIIPLLSDLYYKNKPFIYSASINKRGLLKFQIHNAKR